MEADKEDKGVDDIEGENVSGGAGAAGGGVRTRQTMTAAELEALCQEHPAMADDLRHAPLKQDLDAYVASVRKPYPDDDVFIPVEKPTIMAVPRPLEISLRLPTLTSAASSV